MRDTEKENKLTKAKLSRRKKIFLFSASTFFALILAEIVVRVMLPQPGFQPFPPYQPDGLIVPHPTKAVTTRYPSILLHKAEIKSFLQKRYTDIKWVEMKIKGYDYYVRPPQ